MYVVKCSYQLMKLANQRKISDIRVQIIKQICGYHTHKTKQNKNMYHKYI